LEVTGAPKQFIMIVKRSIFQKTISKARNKFADAFIRLQDGKLYHVHKCVLARQSQYFAKLFKYDSKQYSLRSQYYHLSKVSSAGLTAILHWMYEVN
jgi:hypothetical protein